MRRIVSVVWRWIDRRGWTRGYHVLWLGAGTAVCATAAGGRRSGFPAGRRRAFHRHNRPPDRNRLSPHESRRPACPRSVSRVPLYGTSAFGKGLAPVVLWGRPSSDGRRTEGHEPHPVLARRPSGLYLPMFMFTAIRDQFRSEGAALPRPGARLVPERPGPRAVSVPVLARRQEMGGLSGRQRADPLGRPGQAQGRDHAVLRSGQARPAPEEPAP